MPSLHLQNINKRISILLKYTINVVSKFYLFVTIYAVCHMQITVYTAKTTCSGLTKTALNSVLLPTLFKVVNNTLFNIVTHDCRLVQAQQFVLYC